jgi:hypothetical protein
MWTFDPSEIAGRLHPIFEILGIPYTLQEELQQQSTATPESPVT